MRAESTGRVVLENPLLNRDSAFTGAERDRLGLRGMLPWRVGSLDQQVELELEHIRRKSDDLEKYIGLAALQDRNETLFYRVLMDHLEELAPIVYTPTVGQACSQFSHIMRRPRGIWITPDDVGRIPELLRCGARAEVQLIVATDNERILGLGDQGAGGMAIPVGKLALYTAGAGVHPAATLPVSLDCGTDNEALLNDPKYLGYPHRRLRGPEYDAFIEAFVAAVLETHPKAILQWEHFKQQTAMRLLDRYRSRLPSFNDDIQGTASVVFGGILSALRLKRETLQDQRFVFMGAGAAGIGIARLIEREMLAAGVDAGAVGRSIVMLDSHGLISAVRSDLSEEKHHFAMSVEMARHFRLDPDRPCDLETVVHQVHPTVLIGTCAVPGTFTATVVREMSQAVAVPVILALSNPTAKCEAVPADVMLWSEGCAIMATGSPFDPVTVAGRERVIGQANNVYVFPGVGMGAIISGAQIITDEMFAVAAKTLAERVSWVRLESGALYPPLSDLRSVSHDIALAVAHEAVASGVAEARSDGELEAKLETTLWVPEYGRSDSKWG